MELTPLLSEKQLFDIMNVIRKASHVVLCGHHAPDGDALGATLGMAHYLRSLGKCVNVIMPNPYPDFLRWMPGSHSVTFFCDNEAIAANLINTADLIFLLDFGTLSRLQDMGKAIEHSKAERIMIDHHLDPDLTAARVVVSQPAASSTCELVFRVITQLGGYDNLSTAAAVCLYTGMMTDTGAFTYNSAQPELFYIIGMLLQRGIDKDRIYRNVYHNYSEHRLHFIGYVLNEKLRFYKSNRASIFTITREEMKRFHFIRGDAEGLVNMPLQVKGMRLSISLREDTEKDVIRISLRSVDNFPCNEMAERFFNGGGHLNASGGELPFPLDEAVKTAEAAISAYSAQLN